MSGETDLFDEVIKGMNADERTEATKSFNASESAAPEPASVPAPVEDALDDRALALKMKQDIDSGKILFSDVPMTHPYWAWRDQL